MGHPRQLIPAEKHENFVLLWSLADAIAKRDGTTAEVLWLEIMDAFWSDKIQSLYCFTARKSGPGRELGKLPPREVFAKYLLETDAPPNYGALRGWTLEDYLKYEPFSSYPTRNARFGLAISRVDAKRLQTTLPSAPLPPASPPGRFSHSSAMKFVRAYIARTEDAGRHPTQVGLARAAHEDGKQGGRDLLRAAFNKLMSSAGETVRRGRPKKNT